MIDWNPTAAGVGDGRDDVIARIYDRCICGCGKVMRRRRGQRWYLYISVCDTRWGEHRQVRLYQAVYPAERVGGWTADGQEGT